MKGTFVCHMLVATITLGLAAPDKLITVSNEESVAESDSNITQNAAICETPACVHSASLILQNMDSNVDPCNNFYQFACGKFLEETVIPDDRDTVNIVSAVNDKINQQLRLRISDEIKEHDQPIIKNIKTYYQMCMDTDQIEKTSENDLRKIFENQGGCPILESTCWEEENFDWKKSVYQSNKMGFNADRFVSASVRTDPHNNTKFIVIIDQAETELPGEYYYDGTNNSQVKEYLKGMINIFELLGADKGQIEEVNKILDLEIQLAKISLSRNERRDQSKLNNRMTLHQLDTNYSGIPWSKYLNEILAPHAHLHQQDEVIVADTTFLESLPKLLARTPKRVLANYLCWRTISESMDYLGKELLNVRVELNKVFSGIQQDVPRWKQCLEMVSEKFSPALGELYVRHYFDKDAKTNAIHLTKNVRSSLYHLIEQANWMDDDTKFAALEKLQSVKAHVGYPDQLDESDEKLNEFYQDITLHPGSFLISAMSLEKFKKKLRYSNLKKPVDQWIDHCIVAVANAYYFDSANEFELPAGILQGHFYSANRPNYLNYGAIGSVIGHEMSHAFDDQGSQYDKKGNLLSWWKNETKEAYVRKTKCIIEQFGNYTVKEVNMKIDGINTQAENIADNVGLKAAYFAYDEWAKKNVKEPQLPGLQYTPQQMFWISYANMWCKKVRLEALQTAIIDNPHAPHDLRVIGSVSNLHQFAEDFKCPSGSPMNPVNKCSIW